MTRPAPAPAPRRALLGARAIPLLALLPACSALLDLGSYTARPDAGDDRAPADAAPDAAPLDVAPDAVDDLSPDAPDVALDAAPPPDVAPDVIDVAMDAVDAAFDAAVDAAPDVALDVVDADVAPDTAPDVSPDVTPDVAPDVAPDVTLSPLQPPAPVLQVVTGSYHTCARLTAGAVYCWGVNDWGQLGDGSSVPFSARPVRVALPAGADEIASGADHACARLTDGRVFCWGRNTDGQLGDGTTLARTAPALVALPRVGVWRLAAGEAHTCAALAGQALCWGANGRGEAGQLLGGRAVLVPAEVTGVAAERIAAGARFSCAGDATHLWCWGANTYRELGAPTVTNASSVAPQRVALALGAGESFTGLVAGGYHACARVGAAWSCWGRNDLGQVPGGASPSQPAPLAVPAFNGGAVVAGPLGQCLVRAGGALTCWGYNAFGVAGDGTRDDRRAPAAAPALANVASVAGEPMASLGGLHACAATADGVLRCWGGRVYGGLGDGVAAVFTSPVEVTALRGALDLAAGAFHTCATLPGAGADTRVACAGFNNVGQLGALSAAVEPAPQDVRDGSPAGRALAGPHASLTAGYNHACALAGGAVRCWGFNDQGQLGSGSATESPPFAALPTPAGLRTPTTVAAGGSHTCAATTDAVWCWGNNASGQCGAPLAQTNHPAPFAVPVLPGSVRVQVAAGDAHTCIRTAANTVWCWGANDVGQAGRMAAATVGPGVPVAGGWSGLDGISLGARHSCAWARGGAAWCWGANNRGQSAPGVAVAATSTPTAVAGLAGVTALGAGAEHTCAATSTGLRCWGGNYRGQLGNGAVSERPSDAPVAVALPVDTTVAQVVGGLQHTCARLADGRVFCWGSNHVGQLATAERFAQPTAAAGGVLWR
ncbi:MAG: hypothetical protein U0324_30545 [Polyangiales bacterium]